MEDACIVPDVIDVAPATVVQVTWGGEVKANMGNVATPTQTQNQPTVTWPTEKGALYAFMMTDPDAPSRANPVIGEFRHWLVINIKGNNIKCADTRTGYISPGPPEDTGPHRYVFLVYEQPGHISKDSIPYVSETDPNDRINWKVREFAQTHGLGNPVAGNFMLAEYDDSVPKMQAKFAELQAKKEKEAAHGCKAKCHSK